MKKKVLSLIIAVTMAFSSLSISYARYTSENNTYSYRSTNDLEADVDGEKLVLTWPSVDTSGNLINFNPLKAEGQVESTGNPTAGWTNPTQGMIIEYTGWLPDGTHNTITNDNKTTHNILFGVTDKETEYPIVIKDPKTGDIVKNAYIDTTVVATSLATAYQIQYSEDGINWTEDHIASTFNHGKKLSRLQSDGTVKDDNKNTFFLEDQITEALQSTLKADTTYYIRVNAYDASTPATKNTPFKTFETTITTPEVAEAAVAFPTVEGAGKYTQGGRGSETQKADVYVVTNLTDSVSDPQPGSLRYGLERRDRADGNKSYPRIITFAVGGTITVDQNASKNERRFNITDNTTILGQTAPGEGITTYGASVKFSGKNIIVRYLRCRLGEGYDLDGATASGENIVIDHCTFNWGVDECFTAKELINSSIQYNIIANSLSMVNKNGDLNSDVEIASGESEAKHGMGSILNGYETTFTHNLYANNGTRNPRFEGQFSYNNVTYTNKLDFSNNVIYNWGHNTGYGGERGNGLMNFTNNYHKAGPNTIAKVKDYIFDADGSGNMMTSTYFNGNKLEGNEAVTADNNLGVKDSALYKHLTSPVELTNPYEAESADDAYANVLAGVGASKVRDAQDSRLIYNVKNGVGNFINSQYEDGGVSTEVFEATEVDSDNDGMPDTWEDIHNLNKNDASDATIIITDETSENKGFTNIEVYANSLCTTSQGPTVSALEISDETGVIGTSGLAAYARVYTGKTYTVTPSYEGADSNYKIYINDKVISDNSTVTFDEPGRYNLSAKVTDNNGLSTFSPIITITVIDEKAKDNMTGFTSTDIGNVKFEGTDNYNPEDGTLISQGNGHIGILATMSDQAPDYIHFNYKKVKGDFTFVSQIDNLAKIDYYQQSGLMVRATLDTDSEFYMASLSYLKGEDKEGSTDIAGNAPKAKHITSVFRKATGGQISYSSYTNKFLGVPNVRASEEPNHGWAKLEREGDYVRVSASLDGENWYSLDGYTTTLPEECYVGFATDSAQEYCDQVRYNTTMFSNISLITAPVLGDVNCDSNVTIDDAALLLQYVLNPEKANVTDQGIVNSMVIGNNTITSESVAQILQKALDNSYVFSVEK
ncbi:MAG: DUF1349 domain-containing protein [Lachnospirales bacterium]